MSDQTIIAARDPWQWLVLTASAVAGVVLVHVLLTALVRRVIRNTLFGRDLLHRTKRPARVTLVLLVLLVAEAGAPLEPSVRGIVRHTTGLALMASAAWLTVVVAFVVQDVMLRRYRLDVPDNLRARRIHTQVLVLRRITVLAVTIVTAGAMLMTFAHIRTVGASILASAGVAGLVVGVAARSTLGNLVAGIQIAFTQLVRLDDVLVVEDEWGRVEEMTLTYVVVRLWDERRLVLPISYFVTTPFENWTRRNADLLGTVELHVDHSVPMDAMRAELERILEASDLWDGRAWTLQVVDAGPKTLTVRALMSARDAPTAWDLRCEVRERLVAWLRRDEPSALPRFRMELASDGPAEMRILSSSGDRTGAGARFPWRALR